MPVDERYIPLNVKTYREGFLRLQGWTCVSLLAFVSGALLVLYELMIINVEDMDFRDMLFDYRVTQPGIMYQHKHFVNAQFCCNHDPTIYGYSCSDSDLDAYAAADVAGYAKPQPFCPPVVRFTCANVASPLCFTTRRVVYAAAGLDPQTGMPEDCSRTGRVRLRVESAASAVAGTNLTVEWRGQRQAEAMEIPNSGSADASQVMAFFDLVAERYAEPLYASPPSPLSHSISLGAAPVPLRPGFAAGTWDNSNFGWPWELWPWPPGWACANTGRPPAMYLEGAAPFAFQPYNPETPPIVEFGFYSDSLRLPQYRVDQLTAGEEAAAAAGADAAAAAAGLAATLLGNATGRANGTAAAAATAGSGGGMVVLRALTAAVLRGASFPALDACDAWMLDPEWVDSTYGLEVWRGPRADLLAAAGGASAPSAGTQPISLQLRDVAEPLPLALPRYAGNIYIYAAICMGGLWMFSTAPLIIMFAVVFINVQRNKGLPLFVYKYMRKYRGW